MWQVGRPIFFAQMAAAVAFFWCALCAFFLGFSPFSHAQITDVRLGVQPNGATRVVLESMQPLSPKVFALLQPNRVVIDFEATPFRKDLTTIAQPSSSLITGMREGAFTAQTHRMVLDVKEAVTVKSRPVDDGPDLGQNRGRKRFVVDLFPRGQALENATEADALAALIQTTATYDANTEDLGAFISFIETEQDLAQTTQGSDELKHLLGLLGQPISDDMAMAASSKEVPVLPTPQRPQTIFSEPKPEGYTVVVIDPGHGGVDPGAIGKRRTREKDVVLKIAKKIATELRKRPKTKVYLTRNRDIYVKLSDRVRYAQRKNADVFVSIHADAHTKRSAKGATVYVLSNTGSDKEANRLARMENKADVFAGTDITRESRDVQNLLITMSQTQKLNESLNLARHVIKNMRLAVHMRKTFPLRANFAVLRSSDIPSILVESAYLSNLKEEKLLRSSRHQSKIAKSIAKGVKSYLGDT